MRSIGLPVPPRTSISPDPRAPLTSCHLQDLVAEGNAALERAAQAYRPGTGARFASFAAMPIWQAMQRAVHHQSRTIRLPAHHYKGGRGLLS
jgi:DNA-directed RNA polymerase sigma subunit (sigma70/sigma32)